jgi:CRISPR/Cas system CMR-associated protein Cmr5 small subunit
MSSNCKKQEINLLVGLVQNEAEKSEKEKEKYSRFLHNQPSLVITAKFRKQKSSKN